MTAVGGERAGQEIGDNCSCIVPCPTKNSLCVVVFEGPLLPLEKTS